jgi:hypothetical protein
MGIVPGGGCGCGCSFDLGMEIGEEGGVGVVENRGELGGVMTVERRGEGIGNGCS